MSLKKFLNSFNLIGAVVLLGTHLSYVSHDYIRIIGYILVIWYNWETFKQLKGLKNKRNLINLIVGVLTIVFSVILFVWSVAMLYDSHETSDISGTLFWSFLHVLFASTVATFTFITFRFYTQQQKHS